MKCYEKSIFEDIITTELINEDKLQYCLTFETLKDIKYTTNSYIEENNSNNNSNNNENKSINQIDNEVIYHIRDFKIQAQLFGGMLNSLQEMNDINLRNLLENGLPPIFNDISLTGPVENYGVLRGFRNGINHTQLFIIGSDCQDPVPLKIPPGVTLGGYTRIVSKGDIVFYSRAQPIYHFKSYTLFMNKIRHLLAMIYELFKLGL